MTPTMRRPSFISEASRRRWCGMEWARRQRTPTPTLTLSCVGPDRPDALKRRKNLPHRPPPSFSSNNVGLPELDPISLSISLSHSLSFYSFISLSFSLVFLFLSLSLSPSLPFSLYLLLFLSLSSSFSSSLSKCFIVFLL